MHSLRIIVWEISVTAVFGQGEGKMNVSTLGEFEDDDFIPYMWNSTLLGISLHDSFLAVFISEAL